MSTTLCCCTEAACDCDWPRSLTYAPPGAISDSFGFFHLLLVDGPYTLTYGARPGAVDERAGAEWDNGQPPCVTFADAATWPRPVGYLTLPDESWWSGPISGSIDGCPITAYLQIAIEACNPVLTIFYGADEPTGCNPYYTGPDQTFQRAIVDARRTFHRRTCEPFAYGDADISVTSLTGTHGGDDLGVTRSIGAYFNLSCIFSYKYNLGIDVIDHFGSYPFGPWPLASGPLNARVVGKSSGLGGGGLIGGGYVPTAPVVWASSDTSVFTAASAGPTSPSATLTLVGRGTATLTATVADAYAKNPGDLTRSITVT